MSQGSDLQPLSEEARRLLDYLRRWCSSRDRAQTDAALSQMLHIAHRDIIELRRELIQASHILVSENKDPQGTWIVLPGDDLAGAYRYADRLKGRGVEILAGIWKPLKKAIAKEEASRLTESTGQRRLFA